MPATFGAIITAVSSFVADYQIFLAAGAILAIALWAVNKFVKAGR